MLYRHMLKAFMIMLLCSVFIGSAFAQNDVLVRVMVLPPYPMNLQELVARQNETVVEIQNITSRDLEVELQVRIYSDDADVEVRTDPSRSNGLPIILPPNGTVRLSGADLPDYFNSANVLYRGTSEAQLRDRRAVPEGYYFVCGRVVEAGTLVPLSQEVCSAPIALMSLEPPMLRLNSPLAGGDTVAQTTPQNLIFQWNIPSNIPARAISQLEYTLHLTEVPEGIDPQTVVGSAPANTPGFTVIGSNIYVYGPAAPQLLLGQRYVATLTVRHPDESYTFRNAGRSEPISFVFGTVNDLGPTTTTTTTTGTTLPPILPGTIRGQVSWAYRTGETPVVTQGSTPLVSTQVQQSLSSPPSTASTEESVEPSAVPLAGAHVRLMLIASRSLKRTRILFTTVYLPHFEPETTVATTTADSDGNYRFEGVQPMMLRDPRLRIEVEAGPQFMQARVPVVDPGSSPQTSATLSPIVLGANTFRLSSKVLAKALPPEADVKVQVLARSSLVARQPYLLGRAGVGTASTVNFNGEDWTVLAELQDGDEHRGLLRPAYTHDQFVLRAVASTGEHAEVPLDVAAANSWASPTVPPIESYYQAVPLPTDGFKISGTVSHAGEPRQGALVHVVYTDVATGQQVASPVVGTDATGFYEISQLPFLNSPASYTVKCIDRRITSEVYTEEVSPASGSLVATVNFNIKSQVHVVMGKLLDQFGRPVADALLSSSSGFTTRSSADGVFVLRYRQGAGPIVIEGPLIATRFLSEPAVSNPVPSPMNATAWANLLRNSTVAQEAEAPIDAAYFGLSPGSLISSYASTIDVAEELAGFTEVDDVVVNSIEPTFLLHAQLDGNYVSAQVTLDGTEQRLTDGEGPLTWSTTAGTHTLSITPVAGGPQFVPHFDEIVVDELTPGWGFGLITASSIFHVSLRSAVSITGIIIDSATRAPIAGAIVAVEGVPHADTTDATGSYQLPVLRNRPLRLKYSAAGYNTETEELTPTGSLQLDRSLLARDPNAPDIRTLSGFPVVLDKMAPGTSPDIFVLSGTLSLAGAGNGLYSVSAGHEQISFIDAQVKMVDDTTAIPLGPIALDVATLPTDAFGFAPIDVVGSPIIELRPMNGSTPAEKRVAVIGGNTLLLNLKRFGTIGGLPMSSLPSAYVSNDKFDYAASNINTAAVTNVVGTAMLLGNQEFQGVFASPGKAMDYMSRNATFSLVFAQAAPNFTSIKLKKAKKKKPVDPNAPKLPFVAPTNVTHVKGGLAGGLLNLHIDKEEASVDSSGIHFAGFLELPNVANAIPWPNKGLVRLSAFDVKGDGVVSKVAAEVDASTPVRAKIGKWMMQLDRIIVRGLGSPNVGLGAGGLVILKADSSGNVKPEENLQIKELSFVLGTNGPTLIGELLFPTLGLAMNSLRATTTRPVKIKLETSPLSMSFDGAGVLHYAAGGAATTTSNASGTRTAASGGSGVAGQVFPINIDRFIFRSADWSVFMAASPDKRIDLKAVTLVISKLLVNVGVGMSMSDMASYMELSKTAKYFDPTKRTFVGSSPEMLAYAQDRIDRAERAGKTPSPTDKALVDDAVMRGRVTVKELQDLVARGASSDKLLTSTKMAWAIGLGGTVEFPIKDLNSKVGGSLILAGGGGSGLQVQVNEIFLEVNSPAFHLSASAKMSFGATKWGMEGSGELETMTKKLAASFKFYHHNNPAAGLVGIELGASILVSAGITTGPVIWHTIGGGFDFNTATQKYKVMALGELGPQGTPKAVVYAKNVTLEVLFDVSKCGGVPIVTGTAGLSLKNEDWGSVTAKLDFCRLLATVDVESRKALLNGAAAFDIQGTLFAQAPSGSRPKGGVFLGVNAYTAIGTIATGNIFAAVGINMDRDGTSTPSSVKRLWRNIAASALDGPYDNLLHGVYVGAALTANRQQGSITVPIGGFNAVAFSYDANAVGTANFFKSFARTDFTVDAKVKAKVDASLTLLSIITLNGELDVDAQLAGGYLPASGWYMSGSGSAYLEVYDRKATPCNSMAMVFRRVCSPAWPYICIDLPQATYRFCVNTRASFDLSERKKEIAFALN